MPSEPLRNSEPFQIAIDGPVASGKSTVARRLADRLGFLFLDTGALYRAVAYLVLDHRIALDDESAIDKLVERYPPEVVLDSDSRLHYRIRINGNLLHDQLFTPEVSKAVSPIAAMPGVRRRLTGAQRSFAERRNVVMAGRDIGSVVLPEARFKFYLTADLETRVRRRVEQLAPRGIQVSIEAMRQEILARDARDISRTISPLIQASDAMKVDTSNLNIDQVVDLLERTVRTQTKV